MTAKYQVYQIDKIHKYKWESFGLFGFSKKERTGTCTYRSKYIVAETKEEAVEKYKDRFHCFSLGLQENKVIVDCDDGIGFHYVSNAELVDVSFDIYIPRNLTIDFLKKNLQFNDFFKIATYYEGIYKDMEREGEK